jgi:hypothetical protein
MGNFAENVHVGQQERPGFHENVSTAGTMPQPTTITWAHMHHAGNSVHNCSPVFLPVYTPALHLLSPALRSWLCKVERLGSNVHGTIMMLRLQHLQVANIVSVQA